MVANTRFLLFHWVKVKNLASTALSQVAKRIRSRFQSGFQARIRLAAGAIPDCDKGPPSSPWIARVPKCRQLTIASSASYPAIPQIDEPYYINLPWHLMRPGCRYSLETWNARKIETRRREDRKDI